MTSSLMGPAQTAVRTFSFGGKKQSPRSSSSTSLSSETSIPSNIFDPKRFCQLLDGLTNTLNDVAKGKGIFKSSANQEKLIASPVSSLEPKKIDVLPSPQNFKQMPEKASFVQRVIKSIEKLIVNLGLISFAKKIGQSLSCQTENLQEKSLWQDLENLEDLRLLWLGGQTENDKGLRSQFYTNKETPLNLGLRTREVEVKPGQFENKEEQVYVLHTCGEKIEKVLDLAGDLIITKIYLIRAQGRLKTPLLASSGLGVTGLFAKIVPLKTIAFTACVITAIFMAVIYIRKSYVIWRYNKNLNEMNEQIKEWKQKAIKITSQA